MERILARYTVYAGIAITAFGLVVGFGAMFSDPESPWVRAIGLVPIGFVLLLAGTVVSLLRRQD